MTQKVEYNRNMGFQDIDQIYKNKFRMTLSPLNNFHMDERLTELTEPYIEIKFKYNTKLYTKIETMDGWDGTKLLNNWKNTFVDAP